MKSKKFQILRYIISLLITVIITIYLFPQYYNVLDSSRDFSNLVESKNLKNNQVAVYLINLERSKNRYEYVQNFASKLDLDFRRISAIDGNNLSQKDLEEFVDLETYRKFMGHLPKLGTIGCSLSHFKALETFLNSDFEFALILEDDVSFNPDELKQVIDSSIKNSHLWDIVNFELSHKGTPLTIKHYDSEHNLSIYLTEITHAGAYLINRTYAAKLLEKALPIKMPIDHYFTRAWEFNAKFTGIENPRVVHQTFGDSHIRASSNLEQKPPCLSKLVQKSIYKFQSYIIRAVYNAKLYFSLKEA